MKILASKVSKTYIQPCGTQVQCLIPGRTGTAKLFSKLLALGGSRVETESIGALRHNLFYSQPKPKTGADES